MPLLPGLDHLELVARERHAADIVGRIHPLRPDHELVAVPETDAVAERKVLGLGVDVLGADIDAPRLVHHVVHEPGLIRRVHEFFDIRLPQPAWDTRVLAVRQAVVQLLAELLDFGASRPVLLIVWRRQHTFLDLRARFPRRRQRAVHEENRGHRVVAAGPEPAPRRDIGHRVLRAAVRLLEQVLVVLLGRLERLRRQLERRHRQLRLLLRHLILRAVLRVGDAERGGEQHRRAHHESFPGLHDSPRRMWPRLTTNVSAATSRAPAALPCSDRSSHARSSRTSWSGTCRDRISANAACPRGSDHPRARTRPTQRS